MKVTLRLFVLLLLSVWLTACGGGGGSDGGSTPTTPTTPSTPEPPTSLEIIQSAEDYSSIELKTAATNLADEDYVGLVTVADTQPAIIQNAYNVLFNDDLYAIPDFGDGEFIEARDENGVIDVVFQCQSSGSVKYQGNISNFGIGKVSVVYSSCSNESDGIQITGSSAIDIQEVTTFGMKYTAYFGNLTWSLDGTTISLTGSISFDFEDEYNYVSDQHITFVEGTNQYKLVATASGSGTFIENDYAIYGDVYLSEFGKMSFSLAPTSSSPPFLLDGSIDFEGQSKAQLQFENGPVRLVVDTNGDGAFDSGIYFQSVDELLTSSLERVLVSLDELSLPPIVEVPRLLSSEIYTTTSIEVENHHYEDPDTDFSDLTQWFHWYLNGELLEDYTENVLPPYIAAYGDVLEVTSVVSDGANVVESNRLLIVINDSEATTTIINSPTDIRSGDSVQFNVAYVDPDTSESQGEVVLVAGPSGATLNDGVVNWEVPNDLLFPVQYFRFTFSSNEGSYTASHDFTVTGNNAINLGRSGVEVPIRNNSMVIADIDADGKNELLSTDSASRVFVLNFVDGEYEQTWFYPYQLPTKGGIVQPIVSDIDSNGTNDILVVTEKGVSAIRGLNEMAIALFEVEGNILGAQVADLDSDGEKEIIYLLQTDITSSYDKRVIVASLNNPTELLFQFDVSNAEEISIANVDSDSNYEVVASSGFVYDLVSGDNQWEFDGGFGSEQIAVVDFDGDGVSEIIGIDNLLSKISIFSAETRSEIYSSQMSSVCDLTNGTTDNRNILVVGDCFSASVTSYTMENGELSEFWRVGVQDYDAMSVTFGDVDNDGEVEVLWGTGQSITGANSLITAKPTEGAVTIVDTPSAIELDFFSSASWINILGDDERAIYYVPKTEAFYSGSRYATMTKEGELTVSSELSDNHSSESSAVAVDFNNDGAGDIFAMGTTRETGAFSAIQLSNESVHWEASSGHEGSTSNSISAFDMNADGFEDAILLTEPVVEIYDVENLEIIASYEVGSIDSVAPFMQAEARFIAINSDVQLSILKLTEEGLSLVASQDLDCSVMAVFNSDTDANTEIACASNSEFFLYEFSGSELSQVSRTAVNIEMKEIISDGVGSSNQSLLALELVSGVNDETVNTRIVSLTADGHIVWKSPEFIGHNSSGNNLRSRSNSIGEQEIQLSTTLGMFWIH